MTLPVPRLPYPSTCIKCGCIVRENGPGFCRDCIFTDKLVAETVAETEYALAEGIRKGYIQKVDGWLFGTDKLRRDFDAGLFDNGREGCEMSMKQTFDCFSSLEKRLVAFIHSEYIAKHPEERKADE
jgi:hypothetical protein